MEDDPAPTRAEAGSASAGGDGRPVSRRTVAAVFATAAFGCVVYVVAVTISWPRGFGNPVMITALTVLLAAGWAYPLRFLRNDETECVQPDEAFLVLGLLLIPALGVLVFYPLGVGIGLAWSRTPRLKVIFNIGATMIATVVAIGIFEGLAGQPQAGLTLQRVLAVVLAAAVQSLLTQGLVCMIISVSEGVGFWRNLADGLGYRALTWSSAVSVGLLAALGSSAYNWAPILAALPLAMVYVVLAEHLRARLDRERLERLLTAAQEAHATIETDAVSQALARSACELLHCRDGWVSSTPPGPDERGVRLAISGEREQWLIVSGRKGLGGFDADDVRLLDAIATVGASALENAELVARIRHQATHDRLTGLPNQLLFDDRLTQGVQRAQRLRETLAVLVVDLDSFKTVNGTLGHALGNELLARMGGRLVGTVREVDTVARMSGSGFTLLLPGIGTGDTVGVIAEKLLAAVQQPINIGGHDLYLTASIGIAVYPDDGLHPGALLRNADAAMHRAKEAGGNAARLYDTGMNEQAHLRLARQSELHTALKRDELRVLYQPQVDLRTGRIVGVEALVRWQHPIHGLLGPYEFVPIAEESDLILDVDAWVLRAACRQGLAWDAEGLAPLRIAANLSARHFADDRVVARVAGVIEETGFPASRLELEITESVALRESEGTLAVLRRVRELGVQFAIDDFGTGYSALAQMQRFAVDRLKIDRTFVNQITSAHGAAPLVSAFIGIARALDLEVVAEGVETLEQQTFLRHHGCFEVQGFLYSRPVPADEITKLVRSPSRGLMLDAVH